MPYKHKEVVQIHWTIGDVAKKFNVATSLLRFWETKFSEVRPKRNKRIRNHPRVYREKDIVLLEEIYTLIKVKRYTIEGARNKLRENDQREFATA